MNLDFKQVTYDGELTDFSEEELRELIREFENAQESNVAEFKEAAETLQQVEGLDLGDYQEARSDLIEEITESAKFEDVPLSEDGLEGADFSELREWKEFIEVEADEEDDSDFDDLGENPDLDNGDDEEFSEPVQEHLENITGVVVDE